MSNNLQEKKYCFGVHVSQGNPVHTPENNPRSLQSKAPWCSFRARLHPFANAEMHKNRTRFSQGPKKLRSTSLGTFPLAQLKQGVSPQQEYNLCAPDRPPPFRRVQKRPQPADCAKVLFHFQIEKNNQQIRTLSAKEEAPATVTEIAQIPKASLEYSFE